MKALFDICGHFRSQIEMLLGTISRCYCLPDTLNSLLVLHKIIEKAKQLSKVSDAVTHDEQLHAGDGQPHLFKGPILFCIIM